jgi:hypothetical protein
MKKLLMICILFSSCTAKNSNGISKSHIENLAKEFMKNTVIPQMREPKPYEITDAKVVIKRVADEINDYRFVYEHLSLSKADSIENKRHFDSIIKVSHHPDSIISITVNVAYKTKYRLGDVLTDSIKLGYNKEKDKVSYFPF